MIIMTIRLHVKRGQQAIVPIRFRRAVVGQPVRDAPDVDDRGFAMGTRPPAWGASNAQGAMVGIRQGDTVRIQVLREDIENAADLYVTSSDTELVQVVAPANGGPLPNNGIFQIRGIVDRRNRPVKVRVHYGAADGPVIGELEPHIFQEVSLSVAFHLVTILGTPTTRNAANVQNLLNGVNDIWRPCGIQFTLTNANIVTETIRQNPAGGGGQYRNAANTAWLPLPAPMAGLNFTHAGELTSDATWGGPLGPDEYREFDCLRSLNRRNVSINIYCVNTCSSYDKTGARSTPAWFGLSYVGEARRNGLAIIDASSYYDLAHEIGHFINNEHADNILNPAPPPAQRRIDTRDQNMWMARRLMFSYWPANAPPYRNNVGYGAGQYGALISVKKLAGIYSDYDGELDRSRRHARTIV
jgi:hypothetical protein